MLALASKTTMHGRAVRWYIEYRTFVIKKPRTRKPSNCAWVPEIQRGAQSELADLSKLLGEIRQEIDPEHQADRLVILIFGIGLHGRLG